MHQRHLEGFASGIAAARTAKVAPRAPPERHEGPDAAHLRAQDATAAAGGKLVEQEAWKREQHPFDAYPRLRTQADNAEFPKPPDNFRWRYHGLFYVAPAQNAYMARLRLPNGILTHAQLAGLADLADRDAGGYADVTTRANLQLREIAAANTVQLLESLQDLGLCSRGSGADNIRNVTGDATAGIAAQELLDTRPLARALHFHILNDRSLYGLPRKFNVAFDGGGPIPTLEETNDIGFQAIALTPAAGVWLRLTLGGVTGHRDLARDTGIVLRPEAATRVADAILRVFIDHGDRTNRAKARLKYLLDAWGFEKFIAAVEARLGEPLARVDPAHVEPRPAQNRTAHIGAHPQKQPGLSYLGVLLDGGRMSSDQMRRLAALARGLGDGVIRLTVWQNLLLSGIPDAGIPEARAVLTAAGLVACTGASGCKFAASDTKGDARAIADGCETRVALDQPINLHVTGCHHSCAQHYIGDIGLIGARVAAGSDDETVEGYHIVVGGGFGAQAAIGREIYRDITATDAPATVERLLKTYLAHRAAPTESFHAFTARHSIERLLDLARDEAA